MHGLNRIFWRGAAALYPQYFKDVRRVLEVGSLNVNGSIRDQFENVDTYIGVDWRPGPNVDVVCRASQMSFEKRFHTVASASMLEHDPEWRLSLVNIVSQVRDDGILIMSWGCAGNAPHCHDTALDGHFHPRPAGQVVGILEHLGMHVTFLRYEAMLSKKDRKKPPEDVHRKGMGEVCLIAFKDLAYSTGTPAVDKLLPEDQINWREDPKLKQAGALKPRPKPLRRARKR